MRIIQGKYKGRVLEGFDLLGTRPTMERVKESLFAILQPYIENSVCLDLFAGSGNLGIEALSMGAKSVDFIDINSQAVKIIQKNLTKVGEQQRVFCLDFKKFIQSRAEEKSYNLIFLDPPYQTSYLMEALECITKNNILKEQGLIVCESDTFDKICFDEKSYEVLKEKKYGDKVIRILRKNS